MIDIRNCRAYIEAFLSIRTKEGKLLPLRANPAQLKFYGALRRQHRAGKPMRVIVLKARQMGFSTWTEAMLFQRTATRENVSSLIVAHREDATANLYAMTRLFYDTLPAPLRPMAKNVTAQMLVFENPTRDPREKEARPGLRSRIRCVTAGGKGLGRSDTLHNVHISEFALWGRNKRELLVGILQAVPGLVGTLVVIESTANGFEEFKRMWDAAVAGESDFEPLFFAWFEHPEYQMRVPRGTVWTAEELELKARFKLTDRQLAWRRWAIRNNCSGDEDLFRQEYPATPEEAFITSGRPVFDNRKVLARLAEAPEPVAVGRFVYDYDGLSLRNIRWADDPMGEIAIYQHPEAGHPYVLGGDTAGEGVDWFTGQVIDNATGKQAAVLRHQYDEDVYARQVYCLGMHYNTALVGVETNFSTHPVRELERLGYPKQYVREVPDTYTGALRKSYGFQTNRVTKPGAVGNLVEIVRDSIWAICDKATLAEMLTFSKLEDGGTGALEGEHDDLVMALAIAYQIRAQQSTGITVAADGRRIEWTEDMWEDWRGADASGRAYLEKKWGKPKSGA